MGYKYIYGLEMRDRDGQEKSKVGQGKDKKSCSGIWKSILLCSIG